MFQSVCVAVAFEKARSGTRLCFIVVEGIPTQPCSNGAVFLCLGRKVKLSKVMSCSQISLKCTQVLESTSSLIDHSATAAVNHLQATECLELIGSVQNKPSKLAV